MKTLSGKVISTKMAKTIVVAVDRQRIHPMYKKIMRSTRNYKVHCEDPDIKIGDKVQITETRPISKEKHFKLVKAL